MYLLTYVNLNSQRVGVHILMFIVEGNAEKTFTIFISIQIQSLHYCVSIKDLLSIGTINRQLFLGHPEEN